MRVLVSRDVVREVTDRRGVAARGPEAVVKAGAAVVALRAVMAQVAVKAAAGVASIPALHLRPPDTLHFADPQDTCGASLVGLASRT